MKNHIFYFALTILHISCGFNKNKDESKTVDSTSINNTIEGNITVKDSIDLKLLEIADSLIVLRKPRIKDIKSIEADYMEYQDDLIEIKINNIPNNIVKLDKKKFGFIDKALILRKLNVLTEQEKLKFMLYTEFGIDSINKKYDRQSLRIILIFRDGDNWKYGNELYNEGNFKLKNKKYLKNAYRYLYKNKITYFNPITNYGGVAFSIVDSIDWLSKVDSNDKLYLHQVFESDSGQFYTSSVFTTNPNLKIKNKTKSPTSKIEEYSYGNRGGNCCSNL